VGDRLHRSRPLATAVLRPPADNLLVSPGRAPGTLHAYNAEGTGQEPVVSHYDGTGQQKTAASSATGADGTQYIAVPAGFRRGPWFGRTKYPGLFGEALQKGMPKGDAGSCRRWSHQAVVHEGAGFRACGPAAVRRGRRGNSHDAGKSVAGPHWSRPAQCSRCRIGP